MNEAGRRSARGLGARWVLLCGLGLGAGLAAGLGLASPVQALVGMMLVTPAVLALAGSLFGAAQWLALWRDLRAGALWVAASALGLGAGLTAGVVLVEVTGRAITGGQVRLLSLGPLGRLGGLALAGAVAGLAVGLAQRLALRGRVSVSAWWPVWCALGFGVGLPSGGLAAELLPGGLRHPAGFLTFLVLAGLVVGAVTVRGAVKIAAELPLRRAAG
jgi:hypothetical protein